MRQPVTATTIERYHVKAARRTGAAPPSQHLPRGAPQPSALGDAYAGRSTSKTRVGARAHFDKHEHACRIAHQKIDLAAAKIEIALDQFEPLVFEKGQRPVLKGLADGFRHAGCKKVVGSGEPYFEQSRKLAHPGPTARNVRKTGERETSPGEDQRVVMGNEKRLFTRCQYRASCLLGFVRRQALNFDPCRAAMLQVQRTGRRN